MDVTVRQELLGLLVEELLLRFHLKPTLFHQGQEELLGDLMVLGGRGAAVVVEADVQPGEGLLHLFVVQIHNLPGRGALFFCTKRDRRTVFIAPTNPKHVLARAAQVPDVDVRREVRTGNVSQVNRAIGVGQGGGDHPPLGGAFRHGDKSNPDLD